MNTACVIPVGAGREENLAQVVMSVVEGSLTPSMIVLVADGEAAWIDEDDDLFADQSFSRACQRYGIKPVIVNAQKHEPGMEQPRNYGVRAAEAVAAEAGEELTHVWFLDSDCIVTKQTYACFEGANIANPALRDERILIGPYDWLAPHVREIPPVTFDECRRRELVEQARLFDMGDPRWGSFNEHPPGETLRGDLSAGLACFSGNLIWPLAQFKEIGGFWHELHHGRCEDGELGLRAVAAGVPIAFASLALAFHLWHPRNVGWAQRANARDVPMLNERHPWVEGRCGCGHDDSAHSDGGCRECDCDEFRKALFVVEQDGRRFDASCFCGWQGNSLGIWEHQATHRPIPRP